jgi:tetratricopeptide (TPR) repeat protein
VKKFIAPLLLLALLLLTGFRNPPGAERYMEAGDNAVSEGDPGLGLEYYSRAIKMKPDNALFYLTRGFLLLRLNRTAEAINDLGEYIRILPKVPQGYMSRGMAYSQLKREKEADEDFAAACRLGDASGCSFAGIGR